MQKKKYKVQNSPNFSEFQFQANGVHPPLVWGTWPTSLRRACCCCIATGCFYMIFQWIFNGLGLPTCLRLFKNAQPNLLNALFTKWWKDLFENKIQRFSYATSDGLCLLHTVGWDVRFLPVVFAFNAKRFSFNFVIFEHIRSPFVHKSKRHFLLSFWISNLFLTPFSKYSYHAR